MTPKSHSSTPIVLSAPPPLASSPITVWVSVLELPNSTSVYPYNGHDIVVAVIDSGIDSTHDLGTSGSRVVYSQSFVSGDSSTGDAYGHGTHVAGIVGGDGTSASAAPYVVKGLGTGVKLINLRVLDKNGASSDSTVIAAIQAAISLKTSNKFNIRVINLSLGRPVMTSYQNDPLCQAVEAAWAHGIVVVVAAGNLGRYLPTAGYGTILSPANDPSVITVGAMNTNGTLSRTDDKMASYSSKGPTAIDHIVKPDLVAPGNRILSLRAASSLLASQLSSSVFETNYLQLSGTSMAAPMVSGTAALLLQQNPNLSPDQVKAKLMASADKTFPAATCPSGKTCSSEAFKMTVAADATGSYTTYYDIFTVGAGYLNANDALTSTQTPPDSFDATSPTAGYNSSSGAVSLAGWQRNWGDSVTWGSSNTWGSMAIWGADVLSGTSVTWGTSLLGATPLTASSVIWGCSVTWGSNTPFSDAWLVSPLGEN